MIWKKTDPIRNYTIRISDFASVYVALYDDDVTVGVDFGVSYAPAML